METLKASAEARRVIDCSVIATALRYYRTNVAPIATAKLMADLNRLIAEFDITAKIPLHVDDDGQLIIAGPDNTDALKVTSLNEL